MPCAAETGAPRCGWCPGEHVCWLNVAGPEQPRQLALPLVHPPPVLRHRATGITPERTIAVLLRFVARARRHVAASMAY